MMDWTVMIEAAGDLAAEDVDLDRVAALTDALADYHAATTAARRRYGAQLDVDAPTAEKATEVALSAFCEAAGRVRLPDWPIIHIELMTVEDQQAALTEPTFPDVLGVTEAAQLLGISRQRLAQLASRDDFPEPMVRLAAGPVWLRSSIEGFERRWDRKPGRPAKATQTNKPDAAAASLTAMRRAASAAQQSIAPAARTARQFAAPMKRAASGSFKMPDAKAAKAAKGAKVAKTSRGTSKRVRRD